MRLGRRMMVGGAVVAAMAASLLAAPPARAAGEFRFADGALQASEGQGVVRVVVQRGDLPVSRASVDYRTEAGTATPGSDYTETAGTLTFEVGETSRSFTVLLLDDDVPEHRETVVLRLANPGRSEIRLTIEDDDAWTAATASGEESSGAANASAVAPAVDPGTAAGPPGARTEAPPAVAPRRPAPAVRRAPTAARRVTVRQSPVTPFELRPAPRRDAGPSEPTDVDAGLAVLAALVLARVAAEVWFRTRDLSA